MKKLNFPLIADILFYTICSFVFSFCIMRYYRIPLWISFTIAGLIALAMGAVSFLLLYTCYNRRLLSKKEWEARDALLLHLALEKPERVRASLLSAYLADEKDAHCEGEELCVDNIPVVPLFSMEPISADEIAKLIRRFGKSPFTVACKSLTAEAEKLLVSFGIKAIRGDEIYSLFTRTETIPDPLICGEIPRKTIKQKLRRSFSKSNARPFFISGILLLLMSLFTFFPIYYIVTGSILLLCAVSVRMLGFSS